MPLFAVFGVVIFFLVSLSIKMVFFDILCKEYTDLNLFSMPISAELFQSLNPFLCCFLTPVIMAILCQVSVDVGKSLLLLKRLQLVWELPHWPLL